MRALEIAQAMETGNKDANDIQLVAVIATLEWLLLLNVNHART